MTDYSISGGCRAVFKRLFSLLTTIWPAFCLAALLTGGCSLLHTESNGTTAEFSIAEPVVPESAATTATLVRHLPAIPTPTQSPIPTQANDPVVLDVNGIQVHLSEYRDGLRDYLRNNGDGSYSAELEQSYRRHLIDDLLLYDYGRRVGADKELEYRRRLQRLQRQLLIEYVRRTRILSQVKITEEEVRTYYDEHGSEFATPRMVQVRAIQTSNFRDAEMVLAKVRANPKDFAELARRYSIHPSRSRGGEMDPFPRDTYAKPFEDVAFNLKIGEISPIIATEQGYFIIEKLGEIPEKRPPLSAVRTQIEERLRTQKENEVLKAFLTSLRQYGTVVTHWSAESHE